MVSYEVIISEMIDETTPKRKHDRVVELIEAEKELIRARGMLASWEIFREGISDQYPQLLKWCPQNTIAIHYPELPGVVIVDSVKV